MRNASGTKDTSTGLHAELLVTYLKDEFTGEDVPPFVLVCMSVQARAVAGRGCCFEDNELAPGIRAGNFDRRRIFASMLKF